MKTLTRALAGIASLSFALVGCGGNSGTQPTSLSRTLTIGDGSAYPATSTTVDTVGGQSVAPLAVFSSPTAQQVVLWGSRDAATGSITQVREAVYTASDVYPLYAKYDENGGLVSVKDSHTGSYVKFSALDGSSLVATGVDGTTGKTGSIRATLSSMGVTVVVLDDGGKGRAAGKAQTIPLADLAKVRPLNAPNDPLAGLSSVYRDSSTRTKIIASIFRAASLVVEKPFDKIVSDVAGYLLLDQLQASYTSYTAKGIVAGTSTETTTPYPYVADLP